MPGSSVERQVSTVNVEISEPGHYRIGDEVRSIKCLNGSPFVVGASSMFTLCGTYALSAREFNEESRVPQWVHVTPFSLTGGVLQFEVSCLDGAQNDQLLARDEGKERAVSDAIARMSAGVAAQAQFAQAGVADERGVWSRGI